MNICNYFVPNKEREEVVLSMYITMSVYNDCAFCLCRAPKQTQLTPDQLIYDGRLLSYSAHLTPTVNTVLRETGRLPVDYL